ncbi:NAD(P)H-dependent flavin oxidoreductase [Phenylobacterium sp.]|jgi:nitronate monooxygenase|uniref:NAD(P)H-dependent flavin oxidoreductase n=1 Tax=Phenylobacterium sp. TaxID=1871053 RepID=UPI00378471BB
MSLRGLLAGLEIPILQSPMLGASDGALALAVSEAGAMGALAAAGLAPDEIGPAVATLRAASDRPFSVNLLIVPRVAPEPAEVDAALARLAPWYAELGLEPPAAPNQFAPDFDAQFAAVLAAAPPVASFAFDVLAPARVKALQAAGTLVIGTATSVAEARAWAAAGADGICAQGAEAGGHRGTFLAEGEGSVVATLALVPAVLAAVDLPVIAAGGIMDGRGVAAALTLGAAAAQMGTAFLLSDEATVSAPWRAAIEGAGDDPTRLTRAFTGRYARGIENRFMREMRALEGEVPAYPVQNRLTQPMRAAALAAGDAQMMSLWAGQGVRQAEAGPAGELVRRWWAEAKIAAQVVAQRTGA